KCGRSVTTPARTLPVPWPVPLSDEPAKAAANHATEWRNIADNRASALRKTSQGEQGLTIASRLVESPSLGSHRIVTAHQPSMRRRPGAIFGLSCFLLALAFCS